VSNSEGFPRALAIDGEAAGRALDHEGAATYFRMLTSQVHIREGHYDLALDVLLEVVEPLQRLAAADDAYLSRLQMVLRNTEVLSRHVGRPTGPSRQATGERHVPKGREDRPHR
jgi:hypothetical protein